MDCTPELRLGRWQTALAGVECDALIVDAPYSDRTHGGHRSGATQANTADAGCQRRDIDYAGWSPDDVAAFVAEWAPRTSGWFVSLTDSELAPHWREAFERAGRVTFAPVPCVIMGMTVRLCGDGPSSWAVYAMVSRPAGMKRGTLPGAYIGPQGARGQGFAKEQTAVVGAKPLWLMRAIVRDYSRPGDLVCDPTMGGATTLLAAAIEGRRSIGAEMDAGTYAKAVERIARGYTPVMRLPETRGVQTGLDLAGGA